MMGAQNRLRAVTAKIDELEKQQAEAKQWGAAVGVRHEWLQGLYMEKHRLEEDLGIGAGGIGKSPLNVKEP